LFSRTTTKSMSAGVLSFRGQSTPGKSFTGRRLMYCLQLEPHAQEESLFENARLHAGVSDGSEKDRIHAPQFLEHGIRQHFTGLEIAIAAQVVPHRFVLNSRFPATAQEP